jgi:putative ABC transport system permease protein
VTNDDRDFAPPALGLRLLDRVVRPDARDAIVGDLVERHRRDVTERGLAAARLRFWWEALVAVRHFGSLAGLRRERYQENLMSSFLADLRHAARLLRRAPGFAALCAVTLALAIGPTTAIFSVVDPLLLRSLPYGHPDRLVYVWERDQNGHQITTGFATVQDVRANATTLESLAAVSSWIPTLSDPSSPERLNGSRVTWNYFRTLGVHPMLGRDFVADEDKPIQPTSFGGAKVVLLSYGLWTRRFAADSSIVGHTIQLGGTPWTVVGVLPKSYEDVHESDAQIYTPLGYAVGQPWACRSCRHLTAIARIRDGVSRQRAKAELDQISSQIVTAYPKEYSSAGMFVQPMQEEVTRAVRPALYAIAGAVLLVLLIAVANVVNLQLARAVRRDAEFGVRLALGAGAARLAQQLAAEGLVIAAAGGALGIVLGWATLPLLVARLPRSFPRIDAIHFDLAALAVVGAIVVPLAIVLGVVPARGARKRVLYSGALRGASRVRGADHHRTRSTLVIAEMALALLLLASAGLLARSLVRLLAVDPGFDPNNLITMPVEASGPRYTANDAVLDLRRRTIDAVSAVPGVIGAAVTTSVPLGGNRDQYSIIAQDRPLANPELAPYATGYRIVGDYLKVMRIHLLAGRDFTDQDARDTSSSVAIISQALATTLWGEGGEGTGAIGKRIYIPNAAHHWSTVVGVAADVPHQSLDADDRRSFYVPESAWGWANGSGMLVVRARSTSAALERQVRAAVAGADPSQPVTDMRTMDAVVASSAAQRSLALTLFAAFATLALLLSAAGIYGVLAGSVAERTREIGLRSALGATPGDLLRMVLARGLGLAAVGVVFGLFGALATTRYLRALLFGVGPMDPLMLGAAAALLLIVAAAACFVPARRAIRVDPMEALRE